MQPVAFITGASRGIGRATAIELARAGYRLALVARSATALEETQRLAGGGAVIPTDVTNPDEVRRAVDHAVETYGRIDAVVNNAGLAPRRSVEETTVADWRAVIDTNLSAAFYAAKAAWPHFKRQGGGVIVSVSSMAARDPFPGFVAYAPAKAGVNLLTLSLAREGAPLNIRAHAVAPGATETEMFRSLATEEQFPKSRTMAPADVAKVIAACVRGDLAYTSGETIYLQKP
jgi:3-oxoacyl-[acyl-carrier protein] reductase